MNVENLKLLRAEVARQHPEECDMRRPRRCFIGHTFAAMEVTFSFDPEDWEQAGSWLGLDLKQQAQLFLHKGVYVSELYGLGKDDMLDALDQLIETGTPGWDQELMDRAAQDL